jgi:3-deoxy-D-manno-octulosonate 8-phosphate phosphatase KdsC-like HAD superfamily phosphatase
MLAAIRNGPEIEGTGSPLGADAAYAGLGTCRTGAAEAVPSPAATIITAMKSGAGTCAHTCDLLLRSRASFRIRSRR